MTEQEKRIDRLMTEPPKVAKSWWERVERMFIWLMLTAAVGGIGVAIEKADHVGSCTNTNLGQRNLPNLADKAALKLYLAQQNEAIRKIGSGDRIGGFNELNSSYATYKATTQRDAELLAQSPIGKC